MTSFLRYPSRWGITLFFIAAPFGLNADTLISGTFSTLTPPYETDTGNGWTVGSTDNTELAVGFQGPSGSSYTLTTIQVADNFFAPDPNSSTNPALNNLTVTLLQNTTNNPNTATELQSWTIVPANSTAIPAQTYTLTPVTPTTINPNDYYFLTESVTADGSDSANWGWQENNLTPMQIGYYAGTSTVAGSFSIANTPCTVNPCTASNDPAASGTPAYTVSGDPVSPAGVPEPSFMLPVAGALLLCLFWPRIRLLKKA